MERKICLKKKKPKKQKKHSIYIQVVLTCPFKYRMQNLQMFAAFVKKNQITGALLKWPAEKEIFRLLVNKHIRHWEVPLISQNQIQNAKSPNKKWSCEKRNIIQCSTYSENKCSVSFWRPKHGIYVHQSPCLVPPKAESKILFLCKTITESTHAISSLANRPFTIGWNRPRLIRIQIGTLAFYSIFLFRGSNHTGLISLWR